MTELFPINLGGIEHLVRIHERQARPALTRGNPAIKARAPAGVARGPRLLDPDPDRILIAAQPHLDHTTDQARGFALAPHRVARAAEIPRLAAFDGLSQG